ncbi:Cyanovirin-N [Rhypophila sp. PSN 637]
MLLSQLFLPVLTLVLGAADLSVATPVPEDAVVAVAEPRSIAKRSFLETCRGFPPQGELTLGSGHILNAMCLKSTGQWNWQNTSQDLNLCITNSNGYLQWKSNGVFKFSCPNSGLRHTWIDFGEAIDQVYLWADCYDGSGNLRRSEIRLNDRLNNYDGWMLCSP